MDPDPRVGQAQDRPVAHKAHAGQRAGQRPAQLTRQLGDGGGAGAGVVQVALG